MRSIIPYRVGWGVTWSENTAVQHLQMTLPKIEEALLPSCTLTGSKFFIKILTQTRVTENVTLVFAIAYDEASERSYCLIQHPAVVLFSLGECQQISICQWPHRTGEQVQQGTHSRFFQRG